jgi:hypothetical protein|nr:MAG TPA: hypothetical protein [Caudoviricetes sp.]
MVPNFELAIASIDGITSILTDAIQGRLTEEEADRNIGKIIRAIREYVYNIPRDKELTEFNMYRYTVKLKDTYPEMIENVTALCKLVNPDKVYNLLYWLSGFTNVVVMGILNTLDETLDISKIQELMTFVTKESVLSTMLDNEQEVSNLLAEVFLSLKELTLEAKHYIKDYGVAEVLYYAEFFYNKEEPEESLVVVWDINKDDLDKNIARFKNDS